MNDNYFKALTTFSRITLGSFGAWPTQKNKKLSRSLFIISLLCVLFGVFIPQGCRLFQVWKDLDRLTNVLCTAELPYLVALIKMVVLYRNKQKMSTLYNYMISDWNSEKSSKELNIMIKSGHKGKKFSLICIIMGIFTNNSRLIQWIHANMSNWNSPEHLKNFTLYVDSYYPFIWNYSPTFEIVCCCEYIGTFCATLAYAGTDSFFSQISFHYAAQYHILRLRLLHFINNFNSSKLELQFNEEFANIINVHYHINSCIEIIENNFFLMFLVQLLACTVQFCLLGYFFILYIGQENPSSILVGILFIVVYTIFIIGNFYIYCYLAEMLQTESYAFADAAYECEWFNLPSQKAKSLLLIIQSGNKPVKITAGKFFVFNFRLFRKRKKLTKINLKEKKLMKLTKNNKKLTKMDNKKDYLEVFTLFSRMSLMSFGSWPTQKNEKLSRFLFIISLLCLLFGVFIPQGCKLIQVRENLDHVTNILCTAELTYLVCLLKMIVLYRNKKKMTTLYDYMKDDWNTDKSNKELDIMIKSGRRGKRFSLICIVMGHVTINARLFQMIHANMSNWNSQEHFKNYTLYVDSYFPFTWNYSPIAEILCSFQYIASLCATFAYAGTDSFFSQISFHYTAQYHILRLRFLYLINNFHNAKFDTFNEEFSNIIKFHYHIIRCIEIIESTFYMMFLVQLLACTFQICLQAYYLILYLTHENRNSMLPDIIFIVVFFMYILGNFYIYCYLADMLQMESYAFADTAYESEWFNLPSQKAKCLLLLMQSGKKPKEITAGKFVVFNFRLFGSLVKTSLGYLSFLITMRKS
ncbi:uncharacterized protein LOC127283817 [Leptopilina boulardi]|uniref:uncharacterized protein LOC127283817 n=1 Tax=Leptopilina boulardi TaxID=63433 RepID=UPI0021F559D7|nr:uncharacterized protein LOC127283817 [Leptopilina boulardi]